MLPPLVKSIEHNLGVVFVGIAVGLLGASLDTLMGIGRFTSPAAAIAGAVLVTAGFLLRTWATVHFYRHRMRVISLSPQSTLTTTGPFRFSRNPLYLGGNVLIFFGASLLFGSPSGLVLTAAHLPFIDLFIRREERQLAATFGEKWKHYTKQVRRWL